MQATVVGACMLVCRLCRWPARFCHGQQPQIVCTWKSILVLLVSQPQSMYELCSLQAQVAHDVCSIGVALFWQGGRVIDVQWSRLTSGARSCETIGASDAKCLAEFVAVGWSMTREKRKWWQQWLCCAIFLVELVVHTVWFVISCVMSGCSLCV